MNNAVLLDASFYHNFLLYKSSLHSHQASTDLLYAAYFALINASIHKIISIWLWVTMIKTQNSYWLLFYCSIDHLIYWNFIQHNYCSFTKGWLLSRHQTIRNNEKLVVLLAFESYLLLYFSYNSFFPRNETKQSYQKWFFRLAALSYGS